MNVTGLSQYDASFELISGDPQQEVVGICDHRQLKADHLYFCRGQKFLKPALSCADKTFGVIIEKDSLIKDEVLDAGFLFVAQVDNIALSLCYLSKPFFDLRNKERHHEVDGRQMGTTAIHGTAVVSQQVFIGQRVTIGEHCLVHPGVIIMADCQLGDHCEIFPGTVLHPGTTLGNRVRISSNTSIGGDGFGYQFANGRHHKIWHMGGVTIGDGVEIGSSCTIDQGTFSPTQIGAGTMIDNQVHIAHNVLVGRGVVLCGQVGLSGSCEIGDYSVLGGKAGVAPDCKIGAGSQIAGNAMVTNSFGENSKLGGHPARPLKEWMRGLAYLRKQSLL